MPSNTFSDINTNDTVTYHAQLADGGSLGWLQFNEITRTFSGTPHYHQIGTLHVEVIATDNHGASVSEFFDVTTVNANTLINPIADQIVAEGSAYNFTFASNTFNNVNGIALTYTATLSNGDALPTWLIFDSATRTFSGVADDGDVGVKTILVTANDGFSGFVTDTFVMTINNVNESPFINVPIANQAATGFAPFIFSFGANLAGDPDIGDTLTYSAQLSGGGALPAWLNYNAATRTFSGTPTNAEVGTIAIDVIATDGSGSTATDTFNLVIATGNTPPVNNVPAAQITNEDIALIFSAGNGNQIKITDIDAGDNSIQVNLGVTNGALTLASATGLNFITGTGTNNTSMSFTGTIANINAALAMLTYNSLPNFYGSDTLTLVTNDLGSTGAGIAHSDTDTITITVNSVNDAPAIANVIPNQNAIEDSAFNFTFALNTFTDIDASDTLSYSAELNSGVALPSWLTFNPATRTFSGTPTNTDVGTISVKVTATDSGNATGFDVFDIVVANTNDVPTLANIIPDQVATEDSAFNFTFAANTFNDQDVGDSLTYTAQLSGGVSLPAWLTFNSATRTFSGMPVNTDVGTLIIQVTTNDGNGGIISDVFNIVVANTNDIPTIANAIPNQNALEDTAFSFQFAANTFADVDTGTTLTYSAQLPGGGAIPAWLNFNAATKTFSGTPTNNDVGILSIEVIADDGNGGSVAEIFDISIANTNDLPDITNTIPDQAAIEDSPFNFQFAVNTFDDVDAGTTFTYTAQLSGGAALPSWLSFNATTRTFSGTPANADVGILIIEVSANDGSGGIISDTFNIVIANTNDAPTIANPIPNQGATEDAIFSFQFAANTFADIDAGATLTYTAQLAGGAALPTWLTFNTATRTFTGTPSNNDLGILVIEVTAADGNTGFAVDTFNIVVNNINDAPTVANVIPDQAATEDSPFNFQFAENTFDDADVSTTFTYSAQLSGGGALPSWLSFNVATRTFSGTPANAHVGTLVIEVSANDRSGGIVSDTFNLLIANANDAPFIANPISDQSATQDAAFSFQFADNTFADIDIGDTLTYHAQLSGGAALPAWLSFNSVTRTFSGVPGNADVGNLAIKVIAGDGLGGVVENIFSLAITNANDAPTLVNPIANQSVDENSLFNFTIPANTFNDIDRDDSLTYTVILANGNTLPSWLSYNSATKTLSGIPSNASVGVISILVTATDNSGAIISDSFDLTVVNINNAPVVNNTLGNNVAEPNKQFIYALPATTFTDIDVGDALLYSAQLQTDHHCRHGYILIVIPKIFQGRLQYLILVAT